VENVVSSATAAGGAEGAGGKTGKHNTGFLLGLERYYQPHKLSCTAFINYFSSFTIDHHLYLILFVNTNIFISVKFNKIF
jgi:hypothetical protein